uniref:Nuclear receptor coactivator 2-like n=1 Tax=Phallusia mammillata TaxID=59560 RepID=A0A6F9DLA9_9ASCI|nr:nuclear receptor coactivator 2-like [Phallusia mammillata]
MDRKRATSYEDVCEQMNNIEIQLIEQLAIALREPFPKDNEFGSHFSLVKSKLLCFKPPESFVPPNNKLSEKDKDVPCKVKNVATILNKSENNRQLVSLKKLNSLLALFNAERCIYVSECLTKQSQHAKAFYNKQLEDIFHCEDLLKIKKYFDCNKLEEKVKPESENDLRDERQLDVKVFQVLLRKTDSCDEVTLNSTKEYQKMNCVGLMTRCKSLPKFSDCKADEKILLCLMSPLETDANITPPFDIPVTMATKAPPNQTVNTRVDIPQPETFSTRQDLSGKVTAIDMRHPPSLPTNIHNSSEHSEMTDLIKRCLTTLQEQRKNGSSLFKMHHKQVLQQGQATSITYKFRLSNGSTVTARTKSKLMGLGQQGDPPFILSVHSIFRDGNLQGLDVQGISPAIRSILSGPIVSDPTSTSIATSGILSFISCAPSSSMTSTSSMTSSDLVSDIPGLNNWCTSVSGYVRPRNSVEVARELLASTGAQGNAEEIVNEILSPPPHLDGHLVHTIGSSKSPFSITSVATGSNNSSTSNSNSNQECRSVTTTPDNLATYPGPPCKDISCLKREDQTLPTSCSAQSPHLVINGISTMQHEPVVTTMVTSFPDIKPLIINNPKVTSPHSDVTSSSNLSSRARSASMNSAPPSVNLPKRSISTPSQEEQLKPAQKSPRHKALAGNNYLLTQLLKNTSKVPESHLLGNVADPTLPSTSIATSLTVTSSESLGPLIEQLSPVQDKKTNPSDLAPSSTPNTDGNFFNSSKFKTFQSTRPSVTTNVSKEELDELFSILTGFTDETENNVFSGTPPVLTHPPLPNGDLGQQGNLRDQFGADLPSTDINNNEILPSSTVFDNQFQNKTVQGGFNQDITMTSSFTSTPDFMMPQMDPQPGTMAPMYQGAAMAAVPTGFEPCPNRVVGNAGIVSPQIPAPVQSPMGPAPQYPSFNTQESWEGKEPLVDLGSYPLPRGVNPRMAIPVPNNIDTTMNRLSNGNIVQSNSQIQNDNMTYHRNNQMTRTVRNNGPAMTDMSSQGVPLMNNPGGFPNPRLNNGHMDTGVRSIINNRTNMQPNTGSTLQTNPSLLRRQLQIRLNQPNINGGSFDSSDILPGGVKRGPTPQHMYPRPDVTHTGITVQKRSEYFKANRLQEQKQLAMQRSLAPTNGHAGIMRNSSQINSPLFMPLRNGQQPNLNQQPFPRMGNFAGTQRMSTSPGFSTPGGALPMNGDIYPQSTTITPLQINQPMNGGQHYSLTSTPPIQGFNNLPFSQPVRPVLGMTSPDTQQFSGLSPPLTSQSPKAKKPRIRKSRKNSASKTKPDLKRKQSTDDVSWSDIAPSLGANLLSPQYCPPMATVEAASPPIESKKAKKKIARRMQMTIGDMHQRLQPTFNDASQDAATSSIMTSCSSSQILSPRPQTLNLNNLLDQYKLKQDGQTTTNNFQNTFIQPNGPQHYVPNHATMTSSVTNQWTGQRNKITNNNAFNTNSSIQIDNKPLSNCGDLLLQPTSTNLSENNFFATTTDSNHCDVPMNSNVNNNNTISNCRYTASVASAPILTPPPEATTSSNSNMTSSLALPKRKVERKPSLLETLLLKKDLD